VDKTLIQIIYQISFETVYVVVRTISQSQ